MFICQAVPNGGICLSDGTRGGEDGMGVMGGPGLSPAVISVSAVSRENKQSCRGRHSVGDIQAAQVSLIGHAETANMYLARGFSRQLYPLCNQTSTHVTASGPRRPNDAQMQSQHLWRLLAQPCDKRPRTSESSSPIKPRSKLTSGLLNIEVCRADSPSPREAF